MGYDEDRYRLRVVRNSLDYVSLVLPLYKEGEPAIPIRRDVLDSLVESARLEKAVIEQGGTRSVRFHQLRRTLQWQAQVPDD